MKLQDFLSEGNAASSKRLIAFGLAIAYLVQHFLLMYIKIEIANKDLVQTSQEGIKWLCLCFGGFIALPEIMAKWKGAQGDDKKEDPK
jgi:hypothetical protein